MAKEKIFNRREHDIVINAIVGADTISTTIPAAREKQDDRSVTVPGEAIVDGELLRKLAKTNPVVKHYFDAGYLVFEKV